MLKKHAIVTLTYYIQKDYIEFVEAELNQKGEIVSQQKHELHMIHDVLQDNLNSILEYLEENHGVHDVRLFKIDGFLGDRVSYVLSTDTDEELSSKIHRLPEYFINDEEVLEWVYTIKKVLLKDIY